MSALLQTRTWRDGAAMLRAGTQPRMRLVGGLFYLVLLLVAMLFAHNAVRKVDAAPVLLMLPTGMGWAFLWPSILLAMLELRRLRQPRAYMAGIAALLIALAGSIVLPALCLLPFGVGFARTASLMALAAGVGLLFAVLPGWLGAFMGVLPSAGRHLANTALPGISDLPLFVPMSALLLLAIAGLRAMQLLRRGEIDNAPSMWRPMFMAMQGRSMLGDLRGGSLTEVTQQTQGWMQNPGRLADIGPMQPVTAMRLWLGGMFSPRSRTAWMKIAAFGIAVLAVFPLIDLVSGNKKDPGLILVMVATMSAMIPAAFVLRLRLIVQRSGGDWNELALLPGWGNAPAARSVLLRAVRNAHVASVSIVIVLALVCMAMLGTMDAARMVMAILCVSGIALFTWALSMRVLVGRLPGVLAVLIVIFVGYPLLMVSMIPMMGDAWEVGIGSTFFTVMSAIWLMAGAGCLAFGLHAIRALRAQPHAFLQH